MTSGCFEISKNLEKKSHFQRETKNKVIGIFKIDKFVVSDSYWTNTSAC